MSPSVKRISATRRVAAPVEKIFAIVSHPEGHVRIDGSGMLEAAPDAEPMTMVGQSFSMDMDRSSLGDMPNMTKYTVLNTVTQFVPNELFEWGVGSEQRGMFGHVYGWKLERVNDHETDVTNYCDWNGIPESHLQGRSWPVVPVEMLEQSVAKLEAVLSSE